MSQKSKKGPIIIIVLLSLALLASLSFIVYDKVIKKQPESKEEQPTPAEDKKPVIKEITEQEKTTLLAQINDYNSHLAFNYPFTHQETLNNQEVLRFALQKLNRQSSELMESDLKKILEQYFGKKNVFHHEDIQCFLGDGAWYKYDSATRKYIFQDTHAHGGTTPLKSTTYYLSGTVTNNTNYEIKVNIIYADYCSDICGPTQGYYKTPSKNNNRTDYLLGPYNDSHEVTPQEYESIKDKLDTTIFKFEKDDTGNYGLKSATIS